MRAVICQGCGSSEDVLQIADVDEPAVADDKVLVRVHAASINAADWHIIRGVPSIARLLRVAQAPLRGAGLRRRRQGRSRRQGRHGTPPG